MNQTLGNYILKEKIADGGMGEVFKASRKGPWGFEKTVVLKKLLPFYNDREDFIKMITDEAIISSKLHHPNIVQTLDFKEIGSSYYLEMEYIEGKDLSQILMSSKNKRVYIEPVVALLITNEVLKGLVYAHNLNSGDELKNIVHRDISPQNILVSYDGIVKLADFGIALHPERHSSTKNGELKGKANYMAPEQIRQQEIDSRADIFSLGAVLYELFYGTRPFERSSEYETLKNIAEYETEPEFEVIPGCNRQLPDLLKRSLSKDRQNRFASSAEFQKELAKLIPDEALKTGQKMIKTLMDRLFSPRERVYQRIEKTPLLNQHSCPIEKNRSFAMRCLITFLFSMLMLVVLPFQKEEFKEGFLQNKAGNKKGENLKGSIKYGHVSINSHPWSKLYINGKEMGETPLDMDRLKPGHYVLNMVFPSGSSRVRKFNINPGEKTVIFEKLLKK